jgi:N-carbamoyl-L-amino-acid hydrolase
MNVRKDPFMSLHIILDQLYALTQSNGPWARVTFGNISASPGSFNTVPETLKLAVDLRHPDQTVLDNMQTQMFDIINNAAQKHHVGVEIEKVWQSPAIAFNDDCIQAVDSAAKTLGYTHKQMVSGAGHDSAYISRVVPTSMIFVPCEGGISHNEAENASASDLAAGANVLLHAMLSMANQ